MDNEVQMCLSTAALQKIIVLENGEIKEIGDHRTLNNSGGYYKKLYEMQNKNILS